MLTDINLLKKSLRLIPIEDRSGVAALSLAFFALSIMDLLVLVMLGALSSGVFLFLTSNGERDFGISLGVFDIRLFATSSSLFVVSLAAISLMLLRFILTIRFHKYAMEYLSSVGVKVSGKFMNSFMQYQFHGFANRTSLQNLFVISSGPTNLMVGVIGNALLILSNLFLIGMMISASLFVDARISAIVFSSVILVLFIYNKKLSRQMGILSRNLHDFTLKAEASTSSVLELRNEIAMVGTSTKHVSEFQKRLLSINILKVGSKLISNKTRILYESILLLSLILTVILAFTFNNPNDASESITVFLFISYRVLTAGARVQQEYLEFKAQISISADTLNMHDDFQRISQTCNENCKSNIQQGSFSGRIVLNQLYFAYPGHLQDSISNVTLEIPEGASVCILGPSGCGKSTLVKLMLGLLRPRLGEVQIGGMSASCAFTHFPKTISYFAQTTNLLEGSVVDNIAIAENSPELDENALRRISMVMKIAMLDEQIFPLDKNIGLNGANLSGGERQRLGLARALFYSEKIIVCDEATNALDMETEEEVVSRLLNIPDLTKIIVSHNHQIARKTDLVILMRNGKVHKIGNFEEIKDDLTGPIN